MGSERTRRRLLELTGAAVAASFAGCTDRSDGGRPSEATTRTTSSTTDRTTTTTASTSSSDATTDGTTDDATTTDAGNESAADETTTSLSIDPPTLSFVDVAVPADPDGFEYAVMGSSDAAVTATVYGNWKCPYTRAFVVNQLAGLVDEFVRPGEVAVEFRALAYRGGEPFLGPDAPRAARGGLAVWNADPAGYWRYFASVFENQPDESREWATADALLAFATAADVDGRASVERALASDAHADAVRRTASRARSLGVSSVPRVVVDGEHTAPTVDPESTREQLRTAVADADGA